jgi:hypothetical protein
MNLYRVLPAIFAVSPLWATITASLAPSLPSPQPVGTTITWTPTASDTNPGALEYRYAVASGTSQNFQILLDFDTATLFPWTPYTHEGSYTVQLKVLNAATGESATVTAPFTFTPLTSASGGAPVITPSANPLVALYSGPGCPTGDAFRVRFATGGVAYRTSTVACSPTLTNNIYVAGMKASTTYNMNYEVVSGSTLVTSGPVLKFTTGAVSPSLVFPPISIPLNGSTDTQQPVLLHDPIPGTPPANYFPFATDHNGNILWYYANVPSMDPANIIPVAGGTFLMLVANPNYINQGQQLFREFDPAGNTIRETSVPRVSALLEAKGLLGITEFNHDALRLSNGHTLVIASQEEIFPAGTQGSTAPVDILGDAIVDLDTNMQVAWSWSAYDFLDINRPATLPSDVCIQPPREVGCPPLHLANFANDWIHGNSLTLDSDGNIIFSARDQDFVYKINYANGTGDGSVIWTLGLGGNFTISGTSDPYPWFSHQHDVKVESGTSTTLTLYDNGNTRVFYNPGEFSRGQVLTLDETTLNASLNVNDNMGVFSVALGTAQLLDNGNYHFLSGWIQNAPQPPSAQCIEVTPSGTFDYEMVLGTNVYRTYQMSTLYSTP